MKNVFKILLALFVILASYFAGQYASKSEYESKINELNKKIETVETEKLNLEKTVETLKSDLIKSKETQVNKKTSSK